jgi:hypothetical protein
LLERRINRGQLLLSPTDMRPYGPPRESASILTRRAKACPAPNHPPECCPV